MKKITLHAKNLNNSLVFYHALLDRMPEKITVHQLTYRLKDMNLEINEAIGPFSPQKLVLKELDTLKLAEINKRMKKFFSISQLRNDCEILDSAMGLVDPDGNKWLVGNPSSAVEYQKCYLN